MAAELSTGRRTMGPFCRRCLAAAPPPPRGSRTAATAPRVARVLALLVAEVARPDAAAAGSCGALRGCMDFCEYEPAAGHGSTPLMRSSGRQTCGAEPVEDEWPSVALQMCDESQARPVPGPLDFMHLALEHPRRCHSHVTACVASGLKSEAGLREQQLALLRAPAPGAALDLLRALHASVMRLIRESGGRKKCQAGAAVRTGYHFALGHFLLFFFVAYDALPWNFSLGAKWFGEFSVRDFAKFLRRLEAAVEEARDSAGAEDGVSVKPIAQNPEKLSPAERSRAQKDEAALLVGSSCGRRPLLEKNGPGEPSNDPKKCGPEKNLLQGFISRRIAEWEKRVNAAFVETVFPERGLPHDKLQWGEIDPWASSDNESNFQAKTAVDEALAALAEARRAFSNNVSFPLERFSALNRTCLLAVRSMVERSAADVELVGSEVMRCLNEVERLCRGACEVSLLLHYSTISDGLANGFEGLWSLYEHAAAKNAGKREALAEKDVFTAALLPRFEFCRARHARLLASQEGLLALAPRRSRPAAEAARSAAVSALDEVAVLLGRAAGPAHVRLPAGDAHAVVMRTRSGSAGPSGPALAETESAEKSPAAPERPAAGSYRRSEIYTEVAYRRRSVDGATSNRRSGIYRENEGPAAAGGAGGGAGAVPLFMQGYDPAVQNAGYDAQASSSEESTHCEIR